MELITKNHTIRTQSEEINELTSSIIIKEIELEIPRWWLEEGSRKRAS
jgi:hypothetical protein